MLDKIAKIVARYHELEQQMVAPDVLADHTKLTELAQERSELEPLVGLYERHRKASQELTDARHMLELEEDADLVAMAQEEVDGLTAEIVTLEQDLQTFLVPKDPRDDKNVYIEIRAGAGGDEAGIFAGDLMRMYTRYAENRNWKTEIMDENSTGIGGYKEVVMMVRGKGAFSRLKYESGVHRVQRVPVTEASGRIHTSTATVAVLPELEDVDITLDERELEIVPTYSSGPGGQHMQKNMTAVRITHKPTGITVKIQSERSLTQNKRQGMAIIQAHLQEMEQNKQNAAMAADRKSQVGTGERSEKIRTYNFPQNRVTDHRIGLSNYNLPVVLNGDLDEFIDGLTVADRAEKLAAAADEE